MTVTRAGRFGVVHQPTLMRQTPVLPVALLLAACSGSPTEHLIAVPPGDAPHAGAAVIAATDPKRQWPEDPVTIEQATVAGDSLVLGVRYGGGCRTHTFALVIGPAWMESHPVQVDALLSHDAGGDVCKALLGGRLAFSLLPLRDAYRRAYAATSGEVVLRLRPGSSSVRYAF